MIRYDTIEFNVDSKAEYLALCTTLSLKKRNENKQNDFYLAHARHCGWTVCTLYFWDVTRNKKNTQIEETKTTGLGLRSKGNQKDYGGKDLW